MQARGRRLEHEPSSPFRLWGLLDRSMVFLGLDGSFSSLLPLACILSNRGACAAARALTESSLPPEFKQALLAGRHELQPIASHSLAADSYAVVLLVLRTLAPDSSHLPWLAALDTVPNLSECAQ